MITDRRVLSQQLCNGRLFDELPVEYVAMLHVHVINLQRINKITLKRTVWYFRVRSRCGVARQSCSGVTLVENGRLLCTNYLYAVSQHSSCSP